MNHSIRSTRKEARLRTLACHPWHLGIYSLVAFKGDASARVLQTTTKEH